MDVIGTYKERPFPKTRNATIDTVDEGLSKHHIPILLELDVTLAREAIRRLKEETGTGLSFTGWVITCLGRAVSEHKYVHAMRQGQRKLVIFDDVDISVIVERVAGNPQAAETLPMPYVVRKANQKSVREVHDEIRAAQTQPLEQGEVSMGTGPSPFLLSIFLGLPQFLRKWLVWRRLTRDPFQAKKMMGTVVVTSVGLYGRGSGSNWAIPAGIHPLVVAIGGIARKPGVVEDQIEIREYLGLTVLFDHDVTDGAPVARFLQRLKELMESGYGLNAEENL